MLSQVFFRIVAIIMIVAPIGAFGAMAYTIGNFGLRALLPLGRLMLDVYTTMALFIFVVLNLILRASTASALAITSSYIREEIVLVLGTSSSEAALPRMLDEDGALRLREAGRRAGDPGRATRSTSTARRSTCRWRRSSSRRRSASTWSSASSSSCSAC